MCNRARTLAFFKMIGMLDPRAKIAIFTVFVLIAVFAAEYLYNQMHLNSGPNGWFAVQTTVNVYNGTRGNAPLYQRRVVAGPYHTNAKCVAWLKTVGQYSVSTLCERMLLDDAAREGWSGTNP